MECPSCGHVSREEAPKFCSQCGARLPPAVPAPESENNPAVTPVPEGQLEPAQPLREDGGPLPPLGCSDWPGTGEEPDSGGSCSMVQSSKSKRKRKRNRKKNGSTSASLGLESMSPSLSVPCSLDPLANPGPQGTALPGSPPPPSEPPSQPSPPLGAGAPPGGRRGSLQDQAASLPPAESPVSVAPQDQTSGGALEEEKESAGTGPSTSAGDGAPGKGATAQEPLLPETDGPTLSPGRSPRLLGSRPRPPPLGKLEPRERPLCPGGRAKPGDPKKPEGAAEKEVAAVKKEKVQKDQKAGEVRQSVLGPGEGVTVTFHVLISKDFGLKPDHHRVFIRGGAEFGEPKWKRRVCEMHFTRYLEPHGYLVEGSTVISRQHVDKPIPYKYVVDRGQDGVEYEFIYEEPKNHKGHINRSLHVKSRLLGSGEWHQYDDIACVKPSGKWRQVVNFFVNQAKKIVSGKKLATGIMLDSLLSILETWSAINLSNFFTQFHQFYSVISVPTVYEEQERPWSCLQYQEKQVKEALWEHLNQKVLLHKTGDLPLADLPARRLRVGLVVLRLVQELELPAPATDLVLLCDFLCADARTPEEFHAHLSHIFETSPRWPEYLKKLCQFTMNRGDSCWVGILPVLHRCAERAPRAVDSGIQPEETWAALKGIRFQEFRDKGADEKKLLCFMKNKKHLLDVDAGLFRSWLSLVPLSSVAPYLEDFSDHLRRSPASILDCVLGALYRLQGLKRISYSHLQDVKDTFKMLLKLLRKFKDSIPEGPVIGSLLTVCVKLHEAACRVTEDHMFHHVPALSAEIVCLVTTLKPLPQDREVKLGKNSVRTVVQGTLTTTQNWLRRIFTNSIFQSSVASPAAPVTFTYSQEMQVWRQLVDVGFPEEHGWQESLLRDLEGRLKQERPRSQISAFCNTDWKGAGSGDRVSKCFENCVIEAVSSTCQSHTSILEGISCRDLQRFGTLVSAVISKSWPRSGGVPVNDLREVLKHLLTGPDIKHLFGLYGTNEKLLEHITEEGKELMAIADSVVTKVAEDLRSGRVLVGQLELVRGHQRQFLDIWELKRKSLSPQEKQHDMKQVLDCRWEELQFLREESRFVDSLLKLCERVKPLFKVHFGEIAKRHSEDLSRKSLDEAVTVSSSPSSFDLWRGTHYCLGPNIREMAKTLDSLRDSHTFLTFWTEAAEELHPRVQQEGLVVDVEVVHDHLYVPCLSKFRKLYQTLKSGEVTFAEVDARFKVFRNKYSNLSTDLNIMCSLDPGDRKAWVPQRVRQVQEYHQLQEAADAVRVILEVQEDLGLTGDFSILHFVLGLMNRFESRHHGTLSQIDTQVVDANRLLRGVDGPRLQCLRELTLRKELVRWVREALGGRHDLKVFVDLASISAGENDIDVDRVAYFHDAVQGYTCLLHQLDPGAGFQEFMGQLQELWKALEGDQHLPSKLRDSARNLEWLKMVKESHGSVEQSSLSLATAINSRGIYVIQVPDDGQQISPDTVLCLYLPETQEGSNTVRDYSLEELKELLNKLMLMSGRKDQNSAEVEVFSEVFCSVQRLVRSFIALYAAGNLLFRDWTAEVRCASQAGATVKVDFGLMLLPPLLGRGPPASLLDAVCREMELFLDQWEDFVAQKRAEHFHLNYYTAEQLVYLSLQLLEQQPSADALTMLSFLKPHCSPQDVRLACQGLEGAAAGLQHRMLAEELRCMIKGMSSLEHKLRAIMELSLQSMPAFLPHCLDLDSLGRSLTRLAVMGRPPIHRELPNGLRAGQPNLIVCGPSEVLLAALATYMRSPEQPLPTYDEVLLCGPETTFEEAELLLRRCLSRGSLGRGVYSLVFADRLSYEVAGRVEALLGRLCLQPHREDFQLVLVCDSEREDCYLPSAFSQHRVPVTPQAPLEAMKAYLARHFRVPERTPAAATVFRDRMCVGLVASERAGVGKSLYVKRLHETLQMQFSRRNVPLTVIRLIHPQVDEHRVLGSLLPFLHAQYQTSPMIFHLDITSSVQTGVWEFLFKLLILQYLTDARGKMWLRNPCHLYIVEILEGHSALPKRPSKQRAHTPQFSFLDIFPKVTCRPPKEVIDMKVHGQGPTAEPGMDLKEFYSEAFQRPFQYLRRFHQKQNLDTFQYREDRPEGTPEECIQHLLIYCGVVNPSWSELWNFARFLNHQLRDCEASLFCNHRIVGDTLQGFKNFVVTFMIFMARDFATPTLHTSDQSPGKHVVPMDGIREEDIAPFLLRKRWESEPHPYVFFNDDHTSMTFIGFHLQPNERDLVDAIDPASQTVIKKDVMTSALYQGLLLQRVPFNVDFDQLPRQEKLRCLCLALGVPWLMDPDPTYELTTDNMLKMLAIEMRFRCGIPVVIMGETGCGKTRLIRFLSDLRRGGTDAETMKLVKVHGGTTADVIYTKVREAEELALQNTRKHRLDTILFLDEANTTDAISCVKEVLCDRTVGGRRLAEGSGLHVIAACNPYRRHSPKMIARLEAAGLGYRVGVAETADRLGSIPLRQLVYRVHALPPSLTPLVWDFGQLNDATEKLYIQQIVQRLVDAAEVEGQDMRVIVDVLSASQRFMRKRKNECSFVSLRDVERCVAVFRWFHEHSDMLLSQLGEPDASGDEPDASNGGSPGRHPALWALVLAVGVCYHASLEKQQQYREAICQFLPPPFDSSQAVLDTITQVQDLFLDGVPLRKTVAKNAALKENVFMMVVCIELRIPLFLVGKPGSSKSLAKTIVADAMQGQAAHSDLFRALKQVHLVSFQCSPHSTPQGIISTFRQCARFQQDKDLRQYVSVVVLDEVGLAEDSPKMPLKALHPLLEDGCVEDDPEPHMKVGFIGISNWALDPAKMNRGVFVSRGSPCTKELIESAKGICSSDPLVQERVKGYFSAFAKAYGTVCKKQDKEFFGLRDYYSLVKMVFARAKASDRKPSPQDLAQAILRNFSGKDDIHALDIFAATVPEAGLCGEVSTLQLIRQNVYGAPGQAQAQGGDAEDAESRYLLVLTRNYAALQILQQALFGAGPQPEIIFGSSFPRDQEYAQVCRNINRVKICMETGRMVVLLNLQNLYESLYDALNQYYVYLGGQKYVDLGLGTHRVKCRVHPDFRLIVIEEKEVVYQHFPIPLINRLEKHYLDINTVLEKWQQDLVEELKGWVGQFVDVGAASLGASHGYRPSDAFIGYHSDTCASVVLQVVEGRGHGAVAPEHYQQVLEDAKLVLLDCATPDAVVRLRASALGTFAAESLSRVYHCKQQHDSFADFLQAHLRMPHPEHCAVFTEVTTFSRLLTGPDCQMLESEVTGSYLRPTLLSLQQFDTESSFLREVRKGLAGPASHKILIIQTDFEGSAHSAQLVASAKYSAINEINKVRKQQHCILVYFIAKLSRMESDTPYVGSHGGLWRSVHIDDLRRSTDMISDMTKLQDVTIRELFDPDEEPESELGGGAGDAPEEGMEVEPGAAARVGVDVPSSEADAAKTSGPRSSHTRALDTGHLLRSCIQSAVGLLQDPGECSQRNVRRVEILLSLLAEDDTHRAAFARVAKRRIHDLLTKQEQSFPLHKEWVVKEASNPDALQEAGTFRHTLWRRVQGTVTPLLASVVSVIDRDSNLELLVAPDTPPWARDLWMFIFGDLKLLTVPLVANDSRLRSEMSHILVPSHMQLPEDASSRVPFSWRIRDFVDELGIQAQYISEPAEVPRRLLEIFQQTALGCFLARLRGGERQELLRCYLHDFLLLTMKVSTREELRFLQMALWSCLQQLRAGSPSPEDEPPLPWVHLAYQHFKIRLQNFSRILTLHPPVLRNLTEATQSRYLAAREMTLDAAAAVACTELLQPGLLQPSAQEWLQAVKNLAMPMELLCSEGYLQGPPGLATDLVGKVRNNWNRILSVALFVEHVLLGTVHHLPELCQLVARFVRVLNTRLQEDSNIKTLRPFQAVVETLCECKDQVGKVLSRFGVQACPVCLGDAHDPVCLPCDHVFCLRCVQTCLSIHQMNCPLCLTDLPETFTPEVSQEKRATIEKHAHFRRLCNSFFVDLVSTVCFKDNRPPDKEVVEALLSLLFVEKTLLRGAPHRRREHTKSLSPFDDVVDKTPVIRSVLLKLLLKYSFQEVKGYIQDYLVLLEEKAFVMEEDKTELYLLFSSCLEDAIQEKRSAQYSGDKLTGLSEDTDFLWRHLQGAREPQASVEYLQEVARLRLCLDRAAHILVELQEDSAPAPERQQYLRSVERFCAESGNDWHHVYLVRRLTGLRGLEFVHSLSRPHHPAQWVFPKGVISQQLQGDHLSHVDRYLVHGPEYKAVRDAVGRARVECQPQAINTALQACGSSRTHQAAYLLLALFQEFATLYRSPDTGVHPTPKQREAVIRVVQESQALAPDAREFATSLVTNTQPLLGAGPSGSLSGIVTDMAVHTAVVLLCGQNRVLEPLKNLAFSPAAMAGAFLPTMPEDLMAQARHWKGLEGVHWYVCPNGHHCCIGECGRPMERSLCIECQAPIGGMNHRPEPGFTPVQDHADRTQTGHVLGRPTPGDQAVVSDRGLPPAVFLLTRLLTHLALLLGAAHDQQAVRGLIRPPVRDPREFLEQHIHRDVEQLMKTLGKSADDTASTVHLVLRSLLTARRQRQGPGSFHFEAALSTKDQRNSWEKAAQTIILPELEHLDQALLTVNSLISQDERISSNLVARLVLGDPADFLPHLPRGSVVHSSRMWSCQTRVTVEHLQHVVDQKNGRETVPVLWKFLQKEAELRLVRFLPDILALQKDLVKWFQNASEVPSQSIQDFIDSQSSDGMKQLLRSRVSVFLSTWNTLRRSLETSGEIKLPKDYCLADLNLDSELEVLLPRRQGRGLCSTALASYLISLHNEMIYTVEKFSKEDVSYSVDASEVTDVHVISYEVERDLIPLILSSCQYHVEEGGQSLQELDLDQIQRQVTGRFLQGKPRLALRGLPTLVHRRDWNYERLFASISDHTPQVSLTNAAISAVRGQLQSYSDTCEALFITEVVLGFLRTAGQDPNMSLNAYIQDELRMVHQMEPVLKALHRCQLRHVVSLWQVLSAHRSEQQLRLRKDPLGEITAEYRVELSPEGGKLLSAFLNQGGLDTFLLELHEMMILKLKNPQAKQDFNPSWSLKDTLVSYMETKDSDIPPELEAQFPEEILLCHCVSAWKTAVELKWARQTR